MSHVENGLGIVDIIVFALYVAIIIGVGLWVSRDKKKALKKKYRRLFPRREIATLVGSWFIVNRR